MQELSLVLSSIEAAYGSPPGNEPALSWAGYDWTITNPLYKELNKLCAVEDTTDINYDRSYSLVLGEDSFLILRLSFVAPFALLARDTIEQGTIVDVQSTYLTQLECKIVELCTSKGYAFLNLDVIARRTDYVCSDWFEEDGPMRICHLLFSLAEDDFRSVAEWGKQRGI